MKIEKQKILTELLEQTEKLLNTAISEWQLVPHSQFARRPTPNAWSANECLQHLNSYGRYYLPAIEKSIVPNTDSVREFSPGWLGNYFTNLMKPQQGGKVSKMNSPKDHRPVKILESHVVVSEFIDQQERLLQLLRRSASANWDVRVPISLTRMIKLKLGDVLLFYTAHQERHYLQAQSALHVASANLKVES
jgi:hypothetical protein